MCPETESSAAEDLRIVRDALAGDEDRIRHLCERLVCVHRMVLSFNRRMGLPLGHADLEDVSQDAISQIWRKLAEYQGLARLETWCYRFSFLTFMNALRRTRRLSRVERLQPDLPGSSDSEAADRLLDFERVQQQLEELRPPDADVIRLKYFNDLSFREIAKALGVSATSAKSYFHRGMAQLRKRMG